MMESGRVIVLNGPSSSGKTTLARLVRDLVGLNATVLSIDDLYRGLHPQRRNDWNLFLSLTRALFALAASFAQEGFHVIADTVFERTDCYAECLARVKPFRPIVVGLDCPVDVLVARERARGNRQVGLAENQWQRVHAGITYDLRIDTSTSSPAECAHAVANALRGEVVAARQDVRS